MSVYKDTKRNTWYCQFYYTDWKGDRKQKRKRGFLKKREAQEFERKFLEHFSTAPDITFKSLADKYYEYVKHRRKESTLYNLRGHIDKHYLPFFEKLKIVEITSEYIAKWQNSLILSNYKRSYIKTLTSQLSSIFEHAVRHCGLKENPCRNLDPLKDKDSKKFQIWTEEEFHEFYNLLSNTRQKIMFETLFYTGMRKGELMALTEEDLYYDQQNACYMISITKTYSTVGNKKMITTPKTKKAVRDISISDFLYFDLMAYIKRVPGMKPTDRIFPVNSTYLNDAMISMYKKHPEIRQIKVHDLRHSHASMLIHMKVDIATLSYRLGHENISTTLDTYSHMYGNSQKDVADQLEPKNFKF